MNLMDRRVAERVETNLQARWEGVLTRREGTIVDLSATGCFVLTSDEVKPGELIRIEIQLSEQSWVYFWGEVVYKIPEIGFGLRLTGSSTADEDKLADYIRHKRANQLA
jgi:hypothetical protein